MVSTAKQPRQAMTAAAEIWTMFKESERLARAAREESERLARESREEFDRRLREESRENRRQLKELKQQIGGLGNKFGSFTEGMAIPTMKRILLERFGMEHVAERYTARDKARGTAVEIDVLAWANHKINQAVLVEIKSHPRAESVEQLLGLLDRFHKLFPEHANKKAIGILAGVDWDAEAKQQAIKAGLYVARIKDEMFSLQTPKGFKPRQW